MLCCCEVCFIFGSQGEWMKKGVSAMMIWPQAKSVLILFCFATPGISSTSSSCSSSSSYNVLK